MFLFFVLLYVMLALLNALIALNKGLVDRDHFWGVILCSVLFTPVPVFVVMLFFPRREDVKGR